jgi:PhnB protein
VGRWGVLTARIAPYLLYEDAAGAIEFLTRAFGLRERLRVPTEDGRVSHAELELDGSLVMLGEPGPDYRSPKTAGTRHALVHVSVDDVDSHFERARDAGATIIEPPGDQPYGDRRYAAEDPEGHQWFFAQRVRDLAPEEWGAVVAS